MTTFKKRLAEIKTRRYRKGKGSNHSGTGQKVIPYYSKAPDCRL